jgi:hypothetical protein
MRFFRIWVISQQVIRTGCHKKETRKKIGAMPFLSSLPSGMISLLE